MSYFQGRETRLLKRRGKEKYKERDGGNRYSPSLFLFVLRLMVLWALLDGGGELVYLLKCIFYKGSYYASPKVQPSAWLNCNKK